MRLLPKLLLQLAMLASPLYSVAQLQISDPKTRAVFQRNNQNQAVIPVKGTCAAGTNRVEARLVARNNQGTSTDWKVIDYTIENNQFSGGLAGSAGWYNLEIRSLSTSGVTGTSTLERVGIGEVFIIAGHSVSQGNETSADGTGEDRVNQVYQPYDANFQNYEQTANPEKLTGLVFSQYNNSARPGPFGYNPHIWGKFGEYVAQRYNVPVLIFNAAFGGTNLEHWARSAQGLPFEHSFVRSSIRMPYINVKNTLDRYVRYLGVRAVLCDHGQNDYQNQNVSQLLDYYKIWVTQARNDLGHGPLAFMINRATPQILPSQPNQPIITFPHIRSVQEQMSQQPNAFPGPDYDTGLASAHRPDGIHLTPDGQLRAGQLWADAVSASFLGSSQPWLPGYQETAQQGPNTAPTVAQAIPAQSATVGVSYSYSVPTSTFSDAQNNISTYQISGLPAGLSANGLAISGTPTTPGSSTVTVKATDSGNLSAQTTFTFTVNPAGTNPPPTTSYVNPEGHLDQAGCTTASGWAADRGRPNQSISVDFYVDGALAGTVLANQYRSDLAAVLGDNGLHGFSFSIPTQYQTAGTHTITVKFAGSDRLLNTPSKTYSCSGTPPPPPTNTAPTVVQAIPAQSATVGVSYSYSVPTNTFSDAQNNISSYQISGLPAGLSANGLAISGTPTTPGSSTVTVKAIDSGNLSVQTTFVLTVNPAGTNPPPTNTAPTVAQAIPAQTGVVGVSYSYSVPTSTFSDAQNNISSYQISGLPAGLSANGLAISGTPTTPGSSTVTVKATDSGNLSVQTTFTFTVSPASTNPPPTNPPPTSYVNPEGHLDQAGCSTASGWAADRGRPNQSISVDFYVDGVLAGTVLANQYRSDLAAHLGDNGLHGFNFSIPAQFQTGGNHTLTVKYAGSDRLLNTSTATYNCAGTPPPPPTNTAPTVAQSIPAQSATVGVSYAYSVPSSTFSDAQNNITTYQISGLPAGLSANGLAISGTPTTPGSSTVTVKATDSGNLSVQTTFVLTVNPAGTNPPPPTNTAPTVAQAIPAQTGVVGVSYSYSVPTSTFSDAQNNISTYQISGLPAGLSANGLAISGTPTTPGSSTVTVKATDSGNLSVQTTFTFTVNPAGTNPPPTNPPPTSYVNPEGHLDQAGCSTASGWAADRGQPNQSISVDFYVDGVLAGTVLANQYRSDLAAVLGDNGLHGFSFSIPTQYQTAGTHTITVKFAGSDRLLNTPSKTYPCSGTNPTPTNTAPTVAQAIPAQTGVVGVSFSYSVPTSTFSDAQNNISSYQISGLPAGLSANGLAISGTPTTPGSSTVTVKATDSGNLSVQTTFTFTVSPASTNPPPTNPPPTSYVNPEGHLDQAGCTTASGWAADRGRPNQSISVDLYIDGRLVTTVFANQYRSDLAAVLGDNGLHGFSFQIPNQYRTPGGHTMTAKYAGSDRFLTTSTKSYTCSPSGGRVAAPAEEKVLDVEGNWLSYPNPVEDKITVTIPAAFNPSELGYTIASPTGYETPVTPHAVDGQRVVLPVSSLKTGFYVLSVKKDGRVIKGLKVFKK